LNARPILFFVAIGITLSACNKLNTL